MSTAKRFVYGEYTVIYSPVSAGGFLGVMIKGGIVTHKILPIRDRWTAEGELNDYLDDSAVPELQGRESDVEQSDCHIITTEGGSKIVAVPIVDQKDIVVPIHEFLEPRSSSLFDRNICTKLVGLNMHQDAVLEIKHYALECLENTKYRQGSEWKNTQEFAAQSIDQNPDIREFLANLHTAAWQDKTWQDDDLRDRSVVHDLVRDLFSSLVLLEYCKPHEPDPLPPLTVINLLEKIESSYNALELVGANASQALYQRLNPVFEDEDVFREQTGKAQKIVLGLLDRSQSEQLQVTKDLLAQISQHDSPMEVDHDTWEKTGRALFTLSDVKEFTDLMSGGDVDFLKTFARNCMAGPFIGVTKDAMEDIYEVTEPEKPIKTLRAEKFHLSELVRTLKALQTDRPMGKGEQEIARRSIKQGAALLQEAADYYSERAGGGLPGFDPKTTSIPELLHTDSSVDPGAVTGAFYAAALTQFIIPEFNKKVLGKEL